MKLRFRNEMTQRIMEKKLKNTVEKSVKNEAGGLEIIKEYEFKPEVIRPNQAPELIDYIRVVEVKAKKGTYVKENQIEAVLKNYEDVSYTNTIEEVGTDTETLEKNQTKYINLIGEKTKVTQFYKTKPYEVKGHSFIFNAPNYILEDGDLIEKDLFNVAYKITRNTENEIIYNSLIKEPLKNIEITPEKTSEQVQTELKGFFDLAKSKNKYVYMTLNLLSNFERLSKKLNTPLITDNPNILGGKLLCGIPIIAFSNEVLKPYNKKELLICGDLYNSFDLIKNKEYGFDFSKAAAFDLNMATFRILQNYDFKEEKENLSIAQITII